MAETSRDMYSDPLVTAGRHLGGETVKDASKVGRKGGPGNEQVQMDLLGAAKRLGAEAALPNVQITVVSEIETPTSS